MKNPLIQTVLQNRARNEQEFKTLLRHHQPEIERFCNEIERLVRSCEFVTTKVEKYGFLKLRSRLIEEKTKAEFHRLLTQENYCDGCEIVIPNSWKNKKPHQFIEARCVLEKPRNNQTPYLNVELSHHQYGTLECYTNNPEQVALKIAEIILDNTLLAKPM